MHVSKNMRIFLSIELDNSLKEQIIELQKELRFITHRGKWSHQDNFHLTLKFLGEISPESVSDIIRKLEVSPAGVEDFTLEINHLGRFRGDKTIRVLWLGLKEDNSCLAKLKNKVENELCQLGYPIETRKYSPHITIARDIIPNVRMEEMQELFIQKDFKKIHVTSFHLMLSEYLNRKRVYTSLKSFLLK